MRERATPRFRPGLERLEVKQPLTAGAAAAALAHRAIGPQVVAAHAAGGTVTAKAVKPNLGFLVFRITNPSGFPPNSLTPPFGHVLIQARQPVPGQTYNILQIALKNETNQTFDANSGFFVKTSNQTQFLPILKGNETWKPRQDFIFYILTKKYFPLLNPVSDGFQFKLAGAVSIATPGPSGIFLRIKYNPATINKILDFAATRGPGAQGGAGIPPGLPDTAIWAFVSARENRQDFGGYF
jgi:hypothetical protein